MEKQTSQKSWVQSIEAFTSSRGFHPHIELPGAYYFTTSNCFERRTLSESERDIVVSAIRFLDNKKYTLHAFVVMPDHFHLIIEPLLKSGTAYFGLREIFHSIKSFTAMKIITAEGGITRGQPQHAWVGRPRPTSPNPSPNLTVHSKTSEGNLLLTLKSANLNDEHKEAYLREGNTHNSDVIGDNHIWQHENYDHLIRNEKDYLEKLNYVIYNPVEAKLVENPFDYRWVWHRGMNYQ